MTSRKPSQGRPSNQSLDEIAEGLTPSEIVTRKAYETLAGSWAQEHGGQRVMADQVREFQKLLQGGRVIDLGCGIGPDSDLLVKAGYDVDGVDYSVKMIEQARAAVPQARFHLMSLYHLDFPDSSFDGFWACASLQDIPRRRIVWVLDEISRVTRPNGIGFIAMKESYCDLILKDTIRGVTRYQAGYSRGELQGFLQDTGFSVLGFSRDGGAIDKAQMWLRYFVRRDH